ncbi:DUF6886 family protein [Alkalihalobacillus sp. TS-13]|uniref:DUF6886 family protein n=1 Tax=Alkalihalobacillus sp. TS-13 TaxID=2842455 RepID=UPI001C87C070|nr:DUF6886 family protein [Alkalihalobacillus sp. TS-13]
MSEYYHFSEEGQIKEFQPRKSPSFPEEPPYVWAIDRAHSPLYLFPRNCPRIAFWKNVRTKTEDTQTFNVDTRMVIVIENRWVERLKSGVLYQYTFGGDSFKCFDRNAGYYTSRSTVVPTSVQRLERLPQLLEKEGIEIRCLPTLKSLRYEIPSSTLSFSMIRMRNAIE